MGSWNDILKEVNETQSQYDYVRRKYLKELSDYTGRNTVAYYSSWLNKMTLLTTTLHKIFTITYT